MEPWSFGCEAWFRELKQRSLLPTSPGAGFEAHLRVHPGMSKQGLSRESSRPGACSFTGIWGQSALGFQLRVDQSIQTKSGGFSKLQGVFSKGHEKGRPWEVGGVLVTGHLVNRFRSLHGDSAGCYPGHVLVRGSDVSRPLGHMQLMLRQWWDKGVG